MKNILRVLGRLSVFKVNLRTKSTLSYTINKFNAIHVNEKHLDEIIASDGKLKEQVFEEALKSI